MGNALKSPTPEFGVTSGELVDVWEWFFLRFWKPPTSFAEVFAQTTRFITILMNPHPIQHLGVTATWVWFLGPAAQGGKVSDSATKRDSKTRQGNECGQVRGRRVLLLSGRRQVRMRT